MRLHTTELISNFLVTGVDCEWEPSGVLQVSMALSSGSPATTRSCATALPERRSALVATDDAICDGGEAGEAARTDANTSRSVLHRSRTCFAISYESCASKRPLQAQAKSNRDRAQIWGGGVTADMRQDHACRACLKRRRTLIASLGSSGHR